MTSKECLKRAIPPDMLIDLRQTVWVAMPDQFNPFKGTVVDIWNVHNPDKWFNFAQIRLKAGEYIKIWDNDENQWQKPCPYYVFNSLEDCKAYLNARAIEQIDKLMEQITDLPSLLRFAEKYIGTEMNINDRAIALVAFHEKANEIAGNIVFGDK